MNQQATNLKLAERGALIGIASYIVLAISKLFIGQFLASSALIADGYNNLSDILANLAVLVGLRLARQPADRNHKFGHWKMEDLASLITSFFMFVIGFDVLSDTIQKIFNQDVSTVDPIGALVGLISAGVMFTVYVYNTRLARKVKSKALKAAAKNNLSDALTSLGTSLAIVTSALNFPIVDKLAAIAITFLILKTAYDIFMEAFFSLSDGFDESILAKYEEDILKLPKIVAIKVIRGRHYGSNVYLDIVLEMSPHLSVYESHKVTEQVEQLLNIKYQVFDVDIHVEPAQLPEDELNHDSKKLYQLETAILEKQPGFDKLVQTNFSLIDQDGEILKKQAFLELSFPQKHFIFSDCQSLMLTPQAQLLIYQIDQELHSSIWMKEDDWQLVFHQISPNQKGGNP